MITAIENFDTVVPSESGNHASRSSEKDLHKITEQIQDLSSQKVFDFNDCPNTMNEKYHREEFKGVDKRPSYLFNINILLNVGWYTENTLQYMAALSFKAIGFQIYH